MPAKARAVPVGTAETDDERIAYECGSNRFTDPDTLLYKICQFRGESLRRSRGDSVHWAMQSKNLSTAETARAVILLAEALAEALRNE